MTNEIYRKDWLLDARTPAKATIVLVHGQGEHCGRYAHVAAALNAAGYDVVSGDLPGHGRSGGLRGHIDRFDAFVDVAASWIEAARDRRPETTLFLLGHSVGGLIAARLLQTSPVAGLLSGAVLTSPAFRLRFPIPAWKEALGRRLDGVLPRLRMPSGLKEQRVTRSEDIARATAADPLMVYVASVRFYNELLRAQAAALAEAGRISLPLLLLHGGADEIIAPAPSLDFGARLASPDKDVRLLPGLHHEVLNEPERDDVLRDIVGWLDRHVESGGA
ncbi:lysophospholipase [Paenibacillus sp.]|uniref:alpha/beta hydrolase n=1 Tax=Paenibacillus sp. TaxID=58172 RepID=UPI002D4D7CAD|nr:lysophospholipase [Paenibacillus sp.]HZG56577.1 alpha/beta hydrolase [Paenibacillus sp.]